MEHFITFLKMCLVGCLTGWFFFAILKKKTFGKLWGALIVGVIGAYLGHFVIGTLIDIFAAIVGAVLLVWLLSIVSPD